MQDDLVGACGDTIHREYARLRRAAAQRRRPAEPTVTTEDVWDWVSNQTGGRCALSQ